MNSFYQKQKITVVLFLLLGWSCSKEESINNSSLPQDCAGIAGGTNICGCTDSTAYNFNRDATYDDGAICDALSMGSLKRYLAETKKEKDVVKEKFVDQTTN